MDQRNLLPLGSVAAVNVGAVRSLEWRGTTVATGIWKAPIAGAVEVRGVNVAGDDQADRDVHGGPDKAVYAYASEDAAWWAAELGQAIGPGTFGENLTTIGVDVTNAVVGERWVIGDLLLEVAQPRIPCFKLGIRMADPRFPVRFAAAARPGAYLRIIRPGTITAGDPIRVVDRPSHGVTVGLIERAYHVDDALIPRIVDVPGVPMSWTRWARHQLDVQAALARSRERAS